MGIELSYLDRCLAGAQGARVVVPGGCSPPPLKFTKEEVVTTGILFTFVHLLDPVCHSSFVFQLDDSTNS